MKLNLAQAQHLSSQFFTRRENWPDEDEKVSFLVVILNYGDHLTVINCTGGEWSGIKADLQPRDGVPLCPNGHPLTESNRQVRLGLVDDLYPTDLPASPEAPIYTKKLHSSNHGTNLWFISCDEGWRELIVCSQMYELEANWLLGLLGRIPYRKDISTTERENNVE